MQVFTSRREADEEDEEEEEEEELEVEPRGRPLPFCDTSFLAAVPVDA